MATDGRFGETLSQATFVSGLLPHISSNVIRDREAGRRALPLLLPDPDDSKLPFRLLYKKEHDDAIGAMVWDYFAAVRDRWPKAWDQKGRGFILNKSTGYLALARFLKDAFFELGSVGEIVHKDAFVQLLKKSTLDDDDFTTDRYKPGSTGIAALYYDLVRDCKTNLLPR